MPCESCAVQFSVFKRKRACSECERYYCSGCLRRGGGAMCAPCRVLSTRPLSRQNIANLKVRDLQCFLQRQNVSTRGCVEKEELVNLCVSHVNSSAYRRRGARTGSSPFGAFKGFTNNINDLINSAFDLRSSQPAPPPTNREHSNNCFNTVHAHGSPVNNAAPTSPPYTQPERFTTRPGGESDIRVPVPEAGASSGSASSGSARVDTADCYEIEDLDDAGWEFVTRPADPLPNDSEVLMSSSESNIRRTRSSLSVELTSSDRAASELELRPSEADARADSASLQDEPATIPDSNETSPKHIGLEQFSSASDLQQLSVRQLKELLARNRVEYRGCLERADLLERATTLWNNYAQYKDELESLPLEECCKICMAAPLECVLLECGHIAACTRCAAQLAECPICRRYVVRAVRFFRS